MMFIRNWLSLDYWITLFKIKKIKKYSNIKLVNIEEYPRSIEKQQQLFKKFLNKQLKKVSRTLLKDAAKQYGESVLKSQVSLLIRRNHEKVKEKK